MADTNYTTNVTVADDSQNQVGVTLNGASSVYELRTKDKDVLDALVTGGIFAKTELQVYAETGKLFSIQTAFVTISGSSETDFVLFRNPTGSGKLVEFYRFFYTYTKGSAIALMRLYDAPTVTSTGAAITIQKMLVGGAVAPKALVYQTPTISNRGTLRRVIGNSSVQTYILEKNLALLIPANSDILITITPSANNTDHSIGVEWAEE